jgi:hypothetical protein
VRLILADIDPDTLAPIGQERADRRAAIAAEMHRVAKASEAHLPIDQRRQVLLVQAEQVEQTAEWDRWDWIAYALPWAVLGFGILGPVAYVVLRILV